LDNNVLHYAANRQGKMAAVNIVLLHLQSNIVVSKSSRPIILLRNKRIFEFSGIY